LDITKINKQECGLVKKDHGKYHFGFVLKMSPLKFDFSCLSVYNAHYVINTKNVRVIARTTSKTLSSSTGFLIVAAQLSNVLASAVHILKLERYRED